MDTPATTTRAITATQPRPWISDPTSSPAAPPPTAAVATRLTRDRYGPPWSIMMLIRPPIAGSMASDRFPDAIPMASGTQMATTAWAIAPHGTGAFLGRMTSASQSGTASAIQVTAVRLPGTLLTRSFIPRARGRRKCPPRPEGHRALDGNLGRRYDVLTWPGFLATSGECSTTRRPTLTGRT